ncbi:MAG: hypothetical protein JST22_03155 [Bacteroidetes bacterium]|nr:hypothetical protein [Bacteroidota bacterium]
MNDRKHMVLVALQQALLGEISPNLRAVTVVFDETSIHLDCYYDGNADDDDQESMSSVETEVTAMFPESQRVTHQIHRLDYPALIPKDRTWAYYRKE